MELILPPQQGAKVMHKGAGTAVPADATAMGDFGTELAAAPPPTPVSGTETPKTKVPKQPSRPIPVEISDLSAPDAISEGEVAAQMIVALPLPATQSPETLTPMKTAGPLVAPTLPDSPPDAVPGPVREGASPTLNATPDFQPKEPEIPDEPELRLQRPSTGAVAQSPIPAQTRATAENAHAIATPPSQQVSESPPPVATETRRATPILQVTAFEPTHPEIPDVASHIAPGTAGVSEHLTPPQPRADSVTGPRDAAFRQSAVATPFLAQKPATNSAPIAATQVKVSEVAPQPASTSNTSVEKSVQVTLTQPEATKSPSVQVSFAHAPETTPSTAPVAISVTTETAVQNTPVSQTTGLPEGETPIPKQQALLLPGASDAAPVTAAPVPLPTQKTTAAPVTMPGSPSPFTAPDQAGAVPTVFDGQIKDPETDDLPNDRVREGATAPAVGQTNAGAATSPQQPVATAPVSLTAMTPTAMSEGPAQLLGPSDAVPGVAAPTGPVAPSANLHGVTQVAAPLATTVNTQITNAVRDAPGGTIDIALHPEELGHVRLSLRPDETGLAVTVLAERGETAELIRRHIDQLGQEFRDLGYRDVRFDFGGQGRGGAQSNQPQDPGFDSAGMPASEPVLPAQAPAQPPGIGATGGLDIRL